jgi:hypothetical protein
MPWSDELLNGMRQVCDPPADDVVARIFSSGGIQEINGLMGTLVGNDQLDPAALPDGVREFLNLSAGLPAWADMTRIQTGEQLFWEYGPAMITGLFCDSLPFCYLGRKGVQVLALTARLYTNPLRRVLETAQFLVDTLQRGGLGPAGDGVRTAQKVRMMHAAIRLQVRESGLWQPEFDMPINQEDMAGTLMSFSVVVLDALVKLGFPLTADEQEAYLHCWKVIGHILGVRDELLPPNVASARSLAATIQQRQAGDCPEGRMMTQALVRMLQDHAPPLARHVPATLVRYLLGDRWADLLGVQCPHWEEALAGMLPLIDRPLADAGHDKTIAEVNAWFSRHLVQAVILIDRGGSRPQFRLPAELRGKWGIG